MFLQHIYSIIQISIIGFAGDGGVTAVFVDSNATLVTIVKLPARRTHSQISTAIIRIASRSRRKYINAVDIAYVAAAIAAAHDTHMHHYDIQYQQPDHGFHPRLHCVWLIDNRLWYG